MRRTTGIGLLCLVLGVASNSAMALEPPWGTGEIIFDPAAYSVDVTYLGTTASGYHAYQWDVTWHGTSHLPDPSGAPTEQSMDWFFVYDIGGTTTAGEYMTSGPGSWLDTYYSGHSRDVVASWEGDQFFEPGSSATFRMAFDQKLKTPHLTVVDVGYWQWEAREAAWDYKHGWVTNTPEVPPSVLSMVGFAASTLLYRRRRK